MSADQINAEERQLKVRHHLRVRASIRNFLYAATLNELFQELEISKAKGDQFRAECIRELIDETLPDIQEQE